MTKIEKKNIRVIWKKQYEENNLSWKDYPVFNAETGMALKKPLGFYFSSWEEYLTILKSKNPLLKNP